MAYLGCAGDLREGVVFHTPAKLASLQLFLESLDPARQFRCNAPMTERFRSDKSQPRLLMVRLYLWSYYCRIILLCHQWLLIMAQQNDNCFPLHVPLILVQCPVVLSCSRCSVVEGRCVCVYYCSVPGHVPGAVLQFCCSPFSWITNDKWPIMW